MIKMTKTRVYWVLAALGIMAIVGMLAGYQATLYLKESFTETSTLPSDPRKKDRVKETFQVLLEREPTAEEVERYASADVSEKDLEGRIMTDYSA